MTDPALPTATTFIAARESFCAAPYRDQGGVWTVGYGATVIGGKPVTAATLPMTQEAAYACLEAMTAAVLVKVRGMVYATISDNAAAALTSFAYNLGTAALRNSTLLKLLNGGEPMAEVARQFAAWVYVDQHFDQGLANRRAMEAALFLEGVAPVADEADQLDDEFNSAPQNPTGA